MRGFIGCDAELAPGAVIVTGRHLEMRLIVIGPVDEATARAAWAEQGLGAIRVVAGERFYEVECSTASVGSAN